MPEFNEKRCNKCGLWLGPDFWCKDKSRRDGLQTWCKPCMAAYRVANREKNIEYQKNYRKHGKGKRTKEANRDRYLRRKKWEHLKCVYGVDKKTYEIMLLAQDNGCAICKSTEPGHGKQFLCVDHDHQTGQVRRLLCNRCNQGLGHFGDSIELLLAAAAYLRSFQVTNPSGGLVTA